MDPLVNDLMSAAQTSESTAIRSSIVEAMAIAAGRGGDKITPPMLTRLQSTAISAITDRDDAMRAAGAACAAAVAALLASGGPAEEFVVDVASAQSDVESGEEETSEGKVLAAGMVLAACADRVAVEVRDDVSDMLISALQDVSRPSVRLWACRGVDALIGRPPSHLIGCAGASGAATDGRMKELKKCARVALRRFASVLAGTAMDEEASSDLKVAAVTAIKNVSALLQCLCRYACS